MKSSAFKASPEWILGEHQGQVIRMNHFWAEYTAVLKMGQTASALHVYVLISGRYCLQHHLPVAQFRLMYYRDSPLLSL